MSLNRTIREFALLLALMLPLQSYAAAAACADGPVQSSTATHHCGGEPAAAHRSAYAIEPAAAHRDSYSSEPAAAQRSHYAGARAAIHHNHCGDCCGGTAIALTPEQWMAPRLAAPEISRAALWFPPTVAADRLDRPPRFILA
jgi:hypothetical protein